MTLAEREWLDRWTRSRAGGRRSFLRRATLVLGVMPGLATALIILFVRPEVAGRLIGTPTQATAAFIAITTAGLLFSRWWWNAAEKRFRALDGPLAS